MNALLKSLLLNVDSKVSKTKLGLWIYVLATAILKNNLLEDQATVLQILQYIGSILAGVGARDALDKFKDVIGKK